MAELPGVRSDLEELFAEVKAAEADDRVRPHFLFNALNTIARLIDAGRPADANRTVIALATLLRYGFEPLGDLMPLRDELRVVEAYAVIQNFRFGGRLTLEIAVPPHLRGVSIPPKCLQLLVENGFERIEPKVGPGRVHVSVTADSSCLMIEVTDDGISTGVLSAQMSPLNERLVHQFGQAAGLRVARLEERGTVAQLTLPLHLKGDDQ